MNLTKVKNISKENTASIIFLTIIGLIIFSTYFLDKELSKILGIAGFFTWFLREYFKNWLDKDLEKFKHDLKNESVRFKIQYENLHAERAGIIKRCYQDIVIITGKIDNLVDTLQYKDVTKNDDRYQEVSNDFDKLTKYYLTNALYFEKDTQNLFSALFQQIFQMFNFCQFLKYNRNMVKVNKGNVGFETMTEKEFNESKKNLQENMNKTLTLLKERLENKFKNIIGVEDY